jgi:hypothetical protein
MKSSREAKVIRVTVEGGKIVKQKSPALRFAQSGA